jgi:hypothetical protein
VGLGDADGLEVSEMDALPALIPTPTPVTSKSSAVRMGSGKWGLIWDETKGIITPLDLR